MSSVGSDEEDRKLLAAARSDPAQFEIVFDRYIDAVYRYCLVRLWNREQAEDAASQTFLRTIVALDSYRGGSASAWIFAIARSTVVDMQRKIHQEAAHNLAFNQGASAYSPDEQLLANEEVQWLYRSLARLTESQRQIIELRLAGLSGAEIAAVTGRSHGSVRALQHRAIRRLKREHQNGQREMESRDG